MIRVHILFLVHFLLLGDIAITNIDHVNYMESGILHQYRKERVLHVKVGPSYIIAILFDPLS